MTSIKRVSAVLKGHWKEREKFRWTSSCGHTRCITRWIM